MNWSSSLRCINLTALFRTICIFLFCVRDAIHIGIDGYSITGINNVLTNIVFIFGVRLLNLSCGKISLPFLLF